VRIPYAFVRLDLRKDTGGRIGIPEVPQLIYSNTVTAHILYKSIAYADMPAIKEQYTGLKVNAQTSSIGLDNVANCFIIDHKPIKSRKNNNTSGLSCTNLKPASMALLSIANTAPGSDWDM